MHDWHRYPPQTGTKLTKKRGSKFGALLWRQSDAKEKNRNIGAQLQSILYRNAQKDFGKLTSCRTFGAHKLIHSEPFFGLPIRTLRLLSALGIDVRKKLCTCTSIFSALNNCRGIFFESIRCLYEVVRTNFSADFWTFRNFRNCENFEIGVRVTCDVGYPCCQF